MQLIKPSFQLIEQEPSIEGINKMIELAARIAYKSEDKITEDSYVRFINMLKEKQHYSPFEFGTVYLIVTLGSPMVDVDYTQKYDVVLFYKKNKYSIVKEENDGYYRSYYITTNMRVVIENNRYDDLRFLMPPSVHEKRITFKVVSSIAIMREWLRHRTFSYVQESTRYCNYASNKFNGVTFVIPSSMDIPEIYNIDKSTFHASCNEIDFLGKKEKKFINMLLDAEENYLSLLEDLKPQFARDILPLATKTETMICGFVSDWNHFFELRDSSAAHPDIAMIAKSIRSYFN